jgi:hypothetical protein
VCEHLLQMGARVSGVERHVGATRGDHPEQGDDQVGAVIEEQGHGRRIVGAHRQDGVRDGGDLESEFSICEGVLLVAQGNPLGVQFHHLHQPRDQRALDLVLGK